MEPGPEWSDAGGDGEALSDDDLAQIQQVFTAYAGSGDAFERARLVSALGKTHAPRLFEEVTRLRSENARLRAALRPFVELAEVEEGALADAGQLSEVTARLVAGELRRLLERLRQASL